MSCDVKAYPKAKITWTKSGRRFVGDTVNGRVVVTTTMIKFKNLLPADAGAYECYADNSAGSDRKAMRLNVERGKCFAAMFVCSQQRLRS